MADDPNLSSPSAGAAPPAAESAASSSPPSTSTPGSGSPSTAAPASSGTGAGFASLPSPLSSTGQTGAAAVAGTSGGGAGPVADPAAQQAAPQQPAPNPWLDQVRELGFRDVRDENDARERLLAAHRQQQAQVQYVQQQYAAAAAQAQQYAQLQQDPRFLAYIQQNMQPQAEQPQHWWNPPAQPDLSLLEQYRTPVLDANGQPTGKVAWSPETPAEYRQQVEQYQHHLQQWQADLLTRPHEVIPKIIEHEARRLFEEEYNRRSQQTAAQTFVQQVVSKNENWLFERDPVDPRRPALDPLGNPVPSREGQLMHHFVQEANQAGIRDPQAAWNYALRAVELDLRRQAQNAQQQQRQVVDQNAQAKQELLQRAAAAVPNRAASIQSPGAPGRSSTPGSLGQRLSQSFRAQGIDVTSPV